MSEARSVDDRAARSAATRPPGEATAILTRAVAERLLSRPNRPALQGSRRVALALYVLLLVLPTVVLGGLLWNQLAKDHEALLAAVPGDAADAARRLQEELARRVDDLVRREDERPFFEYRPAYFKPGTIGAEIAFVPSPLAVGPTAAPILGWFSYHAQEEEADDPLQLLLGSRGLEPGATQRAAALRKSAQALRARISKEFFLFRLVRLGLPRQEIFSVPVVAINLSDEDDIDCLREEMHTLRGLQNQAMDVTMTAFRLRFWREEDGTPRVAATRTVSIPPDLARIQMPSCFATLGRGVLLRQGFFLNPDWVFRDLPADLAATVLGSTQRFIPNGAGKPEHDDVFTIAPLRALEIELPQGEDESYGTMQVAVDVGHLESVFKTQTVRLLGVGAMLIVSLATGLVLLLRSVTRDLEAARRTENFVAAVTHELRTPVAAIKLYGEMLDAGWVDSDERRGEYYRRIVRETSRLETLVERVLEKGQLARREARPEPGDLNEVIESLIPSLQSLAPEGVDDLRFELAEDLPPVLQIQDGVRSIVTNLVENARKYAPVAPGGEPLLVQTRREGPHGAILAVLDRGPGIPPAERSRVFQAFYRMGDEHTRTARGTGLGLHLVALHVEAMGGTVEVRGREGGGTEFRIVLRTAPVA